MKQYPHISVTGRARFTHIGPDIDDTDAPLLLTIYDDTDVACQLQFFDGAQLADLEWHVHALRVSLGRDFGIRDIDTGGRL